MLSITPPCTGKIRQVTPTTLSLIVWPLSVTTSPCWLWEIVFTLGTRTHGLLEGAAFRRGLESAVFKKMNGGGSFGMELVTGLEPATR